ncbi:MAG: GNAT family N-acetyltransferase [Oscillospiraceae bacterium]|nr:GNAT family N-acetyltransferase [Oscillospiraceae bacterium]
MVSIRLFADNDVDTLQTNLYPDRSAEEIRDMVREWNSGSYQGKRFEMFAVLRGEEIVGTVSLYALSKSVASIGAEVFEPYRRSGYAYEANLLLLDHAKELGYRVILNQVRTDNAASIRLNEKLGFETDRYVYRNKKEHPVFLFIKAL